MSHYVTLIFLTCHLRVPSPTNFPRDACRPDHHTANQSAVLKGSDILQKSICSRYLSRIGTDSFSPVYPMTELQTITFWNFPALKVCAEAELSVWVKDPIDFDARWIAIVVWIEEIGIQFSGLDSREPFAGYFPFQLTACPDGGAGIDPHSLTLDRIGFG